ncbi:MFS transporter [Alloscardovia venturai]|uniref:MFS transporter n=1 Tax=Alloscardovia venturai TaxID=1769421 RepID=A0ABW2Y7B2_9BIFI
MAQLHTAKKQDASDSSRSSRSSSDFLKHLFVPVYMPAILFSTGEGALIPVVPLTANNLGAPLAISGLISGLLMIGVVLGDIPSSLLVKRFGEAFAMRTAAIMAIVAAIICWKAPNLVVLAVGVLAIGIASATFNLARHAFLTEWTPLWFRARAMSLLGGTTRIGNFIGPFLASPVIAFIGIQSVYWVHVVMCVSVLVLLAIMQDPEAIIARDSEAKVAHDKRMEFARQAQEKAVLQSQHEGGKQKKQLAIVTYFSILVRMGTAAGILQMMRAARQVILPLWGTQLHIPEARIALITGIAGAVDLSLFYTSGQVMDKFGRKWAAIPVLLGIGLSFIAMPLAHQEWSYVVVAICISLANGLGSGIVMTLGSDCAAKFAPEDMPGFLGGWRVFTDSGSAIGPLGISGVTALAGLPVAVIVMGAAGLLGAYMMQRYIPRYVGR